MLRPSSAMVWPTDESATRTFAGVQDTLRTRATNLLRTARTGLDAFPKHGLNFATLQRHTHSD